MCSRSVSVFFTAQTFVGSVAAVRRSTACGPAAAVWTCEPLLSLRHAISLIERRRERPLSSWRGFQAATLSVGNVFWRYSIRDIVLAGVEDECSPPHTRRSSPNSPFCRFFIAVRAQFISSLLRFTFCVFFAASVWRFFLSVHFSAGDSVHPSIRPSVRLSVYPSIIDLASSHFRCSSAAKFCSSLSPH